MEKINKRVEKLEKRVDEIFAKLDTILNKGTSEKFYNEENKQIKDESPREFLLKFHPKNGTEKSLVAIYFLEKKGSKPITVREIADVLKEMREALPKNLSDKIQMLDKRGLVKKVGQEGRRKCWIVSNTGEEYLRRLREDAR